jgi:hypothetical protein
MKPTRPSVLVVVALVAAALAYGAARLWDHYSTLPGVPTSAPVVIAVLAAMVIAIALALRSRLRANGAGPRPPGEPMPKPVDPLQAARAVVLAKASALVGSVVAGVYGGYGAYLARNLDISARQQGAEMSGYAVAAGVVLVLAALYLERLLRLPPDDTGNNPTDTDVTGDWHTNRH